MTSKLVREMPWISAVREHFKTRKDEYTVSRQVLKEWYIDGAHSEMTLNLRVKTIAYDNGWGVSFNQFGHATFTKREDPCQTKTS